ncbi:MAG: GNAT family N-acetyltransferase [Rhodobacteraceae bacterium]|nr:GNAT family N-acetyltransferase [Paracoccaceae bacterium]
MLGDGFHDIPPGKVASVVTHLEMRAPAPVRDCPVPEGAELRRVADPGIAWYRDLFSRVGAHDWLWFSRLRLHDSKLAAILKDADVEIHGLFRGDRAEGLLELDFRAPGECELAFLGVTPALIGTGAGRCLMNLAIARAWRRPIARFHVHTCTLDHPGALSFYRRSGFVPVRQQIEIADDPRLTDGFAPDAGPHVPIFRP